MHTCTSATVLRPSATDFLTEKTVARIVGRNQLFVSIGSVGKLCFVLAVMVAGCSTMVWYLAKALSWIMNCMRTNSNHENEFSIKVGKFSRMVT